MLFCCGMVLVSCKKKEEKQLHISFTVPSAAHCAESWENRNGEKDVENVEFFHKAKRNLSP